MIRRLCKVTTLILLFTVYSAYGAPNPLHLKRDDDSTLTYYLQRNNSDVLLLILQGSDCNSVTRIPLIQSQLKNVWPSADLLLIEKYGIDATLPYDNSDALRQDCPRAYIDYDNPQQRVNDVISVLREVRQQYHYNKVIVLGGSEGAVIANLLSSRLNNLSATIAFNGGGRWFLDDVLHSIEMDAATPSEAEESKASFNQFAQYILSDTPIDLGLTEHGGSWWKGMLSIDQQAVLTAVNTPTLIVQGGKDSSVSAEQVIAMIKTLQDLGKSNIEYLSYPDLDHAFNDITGQSQIEPVITDMRLWLEAELAQ